MGGIAHEVLVSLDRHGGRPRQSCGTGTLGSDFLRKVNLDVGAGGENRTVAQQQGHVAVGFDVGLLHASDFAGVVAGNNEDGLHLVLVHECASLVEGECLSVDFHRLCGVELADEFARGDGLRLVDYGHGHIGDYLGIVDEGVCDGVEQRQGEEEQHHSRIVKHHAEFFCHGYGGIVQPLCYVSEGIHGSFILRNIYGMQEGTFESAQWEHGHQREQDECHEKHP